MGIRIGRIALDRGWKTFALLGGMAVLIAALGLLGWNYARGRETEALQQWVEKQNFIFLVPARAQFMPGDILQWPKPQPGQLPTGDLQLFERSTQVLGDLEDGQFQETGPFNVTLSGSVEAALRAGVLTPSVAAQAKAGGGEDFELIMEDIMIVEAPTALLERAIAGNPDLRQALKDPNRTMISRILRPGRFRYRFFASGNTGFGAKLKQFLGMGDAAAEVESESKFKTAFRMDSDEPLVIGIAMAKLDLSRPAGPAGTAPAVRSLDFDESRTLQTDSNAALWPAGKTIKVRFLEGTAEQKALFREAMAEWLKYANLGVNYVESGQADVRVAFAPQHQSWSYVGTTALRVDPDRPTITLGYPLSYSGARASYLHEIGHALGLVHEFQNPQARGIWKREAVYAHFGRTAGWPRAVVDQMLFSTQAYPGMRALDRRSVMGFAIPGELTRDGQAFIPGNGLSPSDRAYIAGLYPRVR